MKKTIIDQTYTNDQGHLVELGTTDIDAFYGEAAPSYMSKGHHVVRLAHYEMVPEKTVQTRTDLYTAKAYILLDFVDKKSGEVTTTRLYSGFVPYFMDAIALQSEGATSGMKLSQVLSYISKNDIDIWVSYDREYGIRVNYREPRA